MKSRPSARLVVLDSERRVLLFRFEFKQGPLAGMKFWATPGGALESGETFEAAAQRELFEETGFVVDDVGPQIERREFEMRTPDGEIVMADERFFLVRVATQALSNQNWTPLEIEVMTEHRWWSQSELRDTKLRASEVQIFPEDLADIISNCLARA